MNNRKRKLYASQPGNSGLLKTSEITASIAVFAALLWGTSFATGIPVGTLVLQALALINQWLHVLANSF